jgi:dihydropteroate synthase
VTLVPTSRELAVPVARPTVRVEDASLVPAGGPARLALTGMPRAQEVADAVSSARGISHWVGDRLIVTAVPDRLVDAAGRVGGVELADLLREAVERGLSGWLDRRPELRSPGWSLGPDDPPAVMGVLNVTPDSFSDGNAYPDADSAIAAGRALAVAGADLVDVGGESTRPGADPVDLDTELARVLPVVAALAEDGIPVSIDTTKAEVARQAVAAGAVVVNDVSAGRFDPDLLAAVAELDVAYVLMHMRGTPQTMQQEPRYDDVVGEVADFLAAGLTELEGVGVDPARVVIDPGIGFGKTLEHNLTLLARLREFTSFDRPVLVGASRKGFIGTLTGRDDPQERDAASVAVAAMAVDAGARIVRVHDVAGTRDAVVVARAIATAGR